MTRLSYARHRFPPVIIQHTVWLYFRFALSYRDVEDLLAERGIDVSYGTVRRWAFKFGRAYAGQIRRARPRPSDRWHLDEIFVRIGGKLHYLWRAVDDEGEVLDAIVQPRRDRTAGNRGKIPGGGIGLGFPRIGISDSFWGCRRLPISMVCRIPS